MYKLGIDIGSNHIGLGLYDDKKNKLIKKKYIPYKPHKKVIGQVSLSILTKKYVSLLIRKIDSFLEDNKIDYIGIGCPGKVDTEKKIFYGAKELCVGRINFKKEFAKYNCEVFVENDTACAALGEAINNEHDKFFMVSIGTGVGFTIIKKNRKKILLANDETINRINTLNKKTKSKLTYIRSFKSLSDDYNKRKKKKLPREAIFDDLKENKDLLDNYLNDFIEGLNLMIKEFKIKKICIGGGFSLHKRYFFRTLHDAFPKQEIFITKNFSDAGILGAVNLPIKKF